MIHYMLGTDFAGEIHMEFMELLRARHSVRRFRAEQVPLELLEKVLEVVRTAPTAGNFQSYEVYVVSGARLMRALADASFDHGWISQAPMALVVCTNAARCQYDDKEHWALQDASIAATLAHLAIVELGLACCWVGAFIPSKVAKVIDAQVGHVPLALLPFGYADEVPEESARREVTEFVHRRN
jgi:nitroreductase